MFSDAIHRQIPLEVLLWMQDLRATKQYSREEADVFPVLHRNPPLLLYTWFYRRVEVLDGALVQVQLLQSPGYRHKSGRSRGRRTLLVCCH